MVIRSVNWVNEGNKLKYMDVRRLELIDGVWQPLETHMTTKKGKVTLHSTIMKWHNVKFNQRLGQDMFGIRRMEKGL